MTFFRDKFDNEFKTLCQLISPKGITTRISSYTQEFMNYKITYAMQTEQPQIIAIPLVLYNTLKSSNPNDINIQDHVMLCENKADTVITATYDEHKQPLDRNYTCAELFNSEETVETEVDPLNRIPVQLTLVGSISVIGNNISFELECREHSENPSHTNNIVNNGQVIFQIGTLYKGIFTEISDYSSVQDVDYLGHVECSFTKTTETQLQCRAIYIENENYTPYANSTLTMELL